MFFNIERGDIISITGGGGKTSLMFFLANLLKNRGKVLIGTTTKIYKPNEENLIFIYPEEIESLSPQDSFIHIYCPQVHDNKIGSASLEEIKKLKEKFDYIILEADGSQGKFLKGWKENEPCIPLIATKNIVVVDITIIGKEKSRENIHRLEKYLEQFPSDSKIINENIILEYLKKAPLERNALQEKFIFFNKIENLENFKKFYEIANRLERENIFFGSIKNKEINKFQVLSAIILGAGFSKRFGENKLEYKMKNGISILENTILSIKNIKFKEKILTGRGKFAKLIAIKNKLYYIENQNAHQGQSQSVILGAKISSGEGLIYFLGDMPFLKENTIYKLIWNYYKKDKISILTDGVKNSPPTIFPSRYKKDILELQGDSGGREIIKKYGCCKVIVDEKEIFDIDTKEDIKKL